MPRRKSSKVHIYFAKVDAKAREHRKTARHRASSSGAPVVEERTVESLWYDVCPEGWYFIDWHRAWNEGYPTEEHVELYNSVHPEEEQITLVEEDEDG